MSQQTKQAFTPGPWQVHGSHVYGPDPQRQLIAQAHGEGSGEGRAWTALGGSQMVANRNLIAAAPEMLEALQAIYNSSDYNDDIEERPLMVAARLAIAKALGGDHA